VLKNTIYYTGVGVPISIAMGLLLAILLNRKIPGETVFRVIYYIPTVTSAVAIGLIWRWLYNPEFGLINSILRMMGIKGPGWLSDLKWAMPSLIIVHIWQAMGYNMIIYLAGLQNISSELYEAAEIDGATKFQLFRYVTFPLLTPTTFFLLVTSIIGSFQVYTLIAVMTGGAPAYRTAVYVYHLWSVAFQQLKMSYASAMAWILFIIIFLLTLLQLKLSSRWVFYGE
jgi:multiple sugar transport system permease protein